MEFHHDVPHSGTNHSVDQAINSKLTAWKYGVSGDQAEQQGLYMAANWICNCTILDNGDSSGEMYVETALHIHEFLMMRRKDCNMYRNLEEVLV